MLFFSRRHGRRISLVAVGLVFGWLCELPAALLVLLARAPACPSSPAGGACRKCAHDSCSCSLGFTEQLMFDSRLARPAFCAAFLRRFGYSGSRSKQSAALPFSGRGPAAVRARCLAMALVVGQRDRVVKVMD